MTPLLSPDHIALLAKGISAIVASCDAQLRPSIMRAVGTHVGADGSEVTVYLRPSQSRQLLADIAATGRIAVVFSEPSTHRTLQLKASAVRQRPVDARDAERLERYRASMKHEVGLVGHSPEYVAAMLGAMLAAPEQDLVAVEFTPDAAFNQTPGPRAGAPLPAPGPAQGEAQ